MRVIIRRPALGCMTGITFLRGIKMIPAFAGGDRTVVTGRAITVNSLVIECAAFEGCGGMTVGAIQVVGIYMIR